MKTDIQIAQEATMLPIKEVTAKIGLTEDDLELYGKYKAKISNEYWNKIKDNEDGKDVYKRQPNYLCRRNCKCRSDR